MQEGAGYTETMFSASKPSKSYKYFPATPHTMYDRTALLYGNNHQVPIASISISAEKFSDKFINPRLMEQITS
jgi:hypothetical protein